MILMRANEKPVIIWTENGCWFQQRTDGILRSSYLGHIGTPDEVREWCECNATDFTGKFHDFAGTAIKEKWPEKICAPDSAHVAGGEACPAAPVGRGRIPLDSVAEHAPVLPGRQKRA